MKLMFRPLLFHLLLCCATQTLGVQIQSVPEVNSEGVIQTERDRIVSLVCQTQADEELVWLRNDAAVILKEGNTKGRSSVCVSPVSLADNGATFTCHQRNNNTVMASVTLNVTYHPQLSGSEEVSVEENDVLVLQCDTRANPPVTSLSWTLNGSTVDLLAGGFSVTNDGSTSRLTANSAKQGLHDGTYQCSAESPIYGGHSKQFIVKVTEMTADFPVMPMIAGLVVVVLTAILAIVSRWKKIAKCCK